MTRIRSTYSLIRDHKYRSLAASNLFGGFSYGDADAIECNRIRKVLQPVTDASRPEGAMLGLDFAPANSALGGSESGACSWGTVTQTEQNRFRLIILLRKRRHQVSEKGRFLFDAANFTDRSGPFAVRACSVQAGR